MEIQPDDLTGNAIIALLQEHLAHMRSVSPPESTHALDLDGLRAPDVSFWSAWSGQTLLGCCALRQISASQGEIKSMRTASAHLRKGIAAQLLEHLFDEARRRGYRTLLLETGSMDAFRPARTLYRRYGFAECAPFASYQPDTNSVYMQCICPHCLLKASRAGLAIPNEPSPCYFTKGQPETDMPQAKSVRIEFCKV